MKKRNLIIFTLLLVLIIANLATIVFSVISNGAITVSDMINIIITIILGVATLTQTNQEIRNNEQSLEINVKQNTPYLIISGINKRDLDSKYDIKNNLPYKKELVEDPIVTRNCPICFVGYTQSNVQISTMFKNVSEVLINKIEILENNNVNALNYQKDFVSGIIQLKDMIPGYVEELEKEEILNENISYANSNDVIPVNISIPNSKVIFCDITKNGHEVLKINFSCLITTIYNDKYVQNFNIKLLRVAEASYKGQTFPIYENRYVYEIRSIDTSVISSEFNSK